MLELIGMFGGGTFGAVTKFISDYMKDKREIAQEKHNRKMAELGFIKEQSKMLIELENKVPGLSFTKRIISFLIVGAVVGIIYFPNVLGTNVPVTETVTTTWFWLIETETVKDIYVNLKGGVLTKEITVAFLTIIASYFGASIASRR